MADGSSVKYVPGTACLRVLDDRRSHESWCSVKKCSVDAKIASRASAVVAVMVMACCHCSSSSSPGASSPDAGGASDATPDAPGDAGAETGGKPAAPTQLRAFESNAEGISDACKVGDYVKAQGVLGEANTNWNTLKPLVGPAGASAALIAKIDAGLSKMAADVTGKLQRECESDANAATLTIPDLFDLYTFPVPSDALRGDGVFRQLQIDSEYKDFTAAVPDLANTKAVWARLRPLAVVQASKRTDVPGTGTVVSDMDSAIQKCEAAITATDQAALGTEAQNGLDYIDTVETMFK